MSQESSKEEKRKFPILPNQNKKSLLNTENENKFLQGNFLIKPLDITDPKSNLNNPPLNLESQEKFLNSGDYYVKKLNKKEKDKNPRNFKTDQYLGDFRLNDSSVRIIFRDHEMPDGDRVKITHNDVVLFPDVTLFQNFVGLTLNLVSGFNKIDFIALNQGSSGPNTAEVRVYNENGDLVSANQWNLATGVRATYILVKE
ncbi:MAG: hypothetical protein CMC91_03630 [Flavobacteriaceae bacterium]|nr:hypothetical protein [Flavobacteriaceae bacterium]|tara:strand:+ start:3682 stop:4281 length:600 start_codon:yes stop_codon:yes gene_type:complete